MSNPLLVLSKFLDLHFTNYDTVLMLGDLNIMEDEPQMQSFCDAYKIVAELTYLI